MQNRFQGGPRHSGPGEYEPADHAKHIEQRPDETGNAGTLLLGPAEGIAKLQVLKRRQSRCDHAIAKPFLEHRASAHCSERHVALEGGCLSRGTSLPHWILVRPYQGEMPPRKVKDAGSHLSNEGGESVPSITSAHQNPFCPNRKISV